MNIPVFWFFAFLCAAGMIGVFFGAIFAVREEKKKELYEKSTADDPISRDRVKEILRIQKAIDEAPVDDPQAQFKQGYRAALLLGPWR